MEVETPLLCSTGVTDPSVEPLVVTDGDEKIRDSIYLTTEMRLAADPWRGLHGYIKEMIARKYNVPEENVWYRVHTTWTEGGMMYRFNRDMGEVECLGPSR